jgi:hypothetical protein
VDPSGQDAVAAIDVLDVGQRLGFGADGADASIYEPELLREYHEIILEPFLYDEAFDFAKWRPRAPAQRFVLKNPRFLKLVPPADALVYFRVLSGIKGLLAKMKARLNVHRMAVQTARRRRRLSAEPQASHRPTLSI